MAVRTRHISSRKDDSTHSSLINHISSVADCGTVMIQTLEKFWFRLRFWPRFWFRIQTMYSTVFQQQKICTKSCFSNVRSSIISQKAGLSFLFFFWFFITFYVGFRSKSGTGTVMLSSSGSSKAKSYGSCGSSSAFWQKVTVPAVPIR